MQKKYLIEKKWLKKICKKTKSNTFIYISSGSVYQKKHPIGFAKLQCEKFYQKTPIQIICRYGDLLIFYPQSTLNLSDHFHNILIKKFLIEKKRKIIFLVLKMINVAILQLKIFVIKFLNIVRKKLNFKYDYGNTKLISVVKIIEDYLKIYLTE